MSFKDVPHFPDGGWGGRKQWCSHVAGSSAKSDGCVLTLGHFDQMVSPGSVSEGIPFLSSQLSSYSQGLAKRRDTCPVYKLADFAEEGLNTITIFLAQSSGERMPPCVLLILHPQSCGLRERSILQMKEGFLPSIS